MKTSASVVVVVLALLTTGCSGVEHSTKRDVSPEPRKDTADFDQQWNSKVASDLEEQYNLVLRVGDEAQMCSSAMMVAAAYLQAKDEKNYVKWNAIKKEKCDR